MLKSVVAFSIRFRGLVTTFAFVAIAYGVWQMSRTGLDIFPEFSPKAVIIQTEAPGFNAERVEILVTQPVERSMTGLADLDHVRSESIEGLSVVTVVFADNTDIIRNRQFVAERLNALGASLPPNVAPPLAVPLASSSATVRTIGVNSKSLDLMQLRDLVDAVIVPRLLSVAGVADVNVFGGAVRSLQIQPNVERLRFFNISIAELLAPLRGVSEAASLGFIEDDNQRLSLEFRDVPPSAAALGEIVVRDDERGAIRVADVANVLFAGDPPFGAAQIGGEPAIVMMVIGQLGANTLSVSNRLDAVLRDFEVQLGLQGVILSPRLFVPANYIEASLDNIAAHIVLGGSFVLIVLLLFLFDARAAFISALAIPLSLLGAVIVLIASGVNLNIMVLGGLAIALGEVVDDAIIDTENIYRRLRENRAKKSRRSASEVILDASLEVRGSVVYASFIVILVFVPLLTLSGVAGRLFAPLGVTYILAVLASLIVALTITPALCALLIKEDDIRADEPPLIRRLQPGYGAIVRGLSRYPLLPPIVVALVLIVIAGALPRFATQFLPPLREGHYIVHTTSLPGTSLAESIRIGTRLSSEFLEISGVASVSQWAGRAARGADTYGAHYSEYEVALDELDGAGQQRVLEQLRAVLAAQPGILFEANTFLTERVDETIAGYSASVVINVFGKNLDELDRRALEISQVLKTVDGARDVQIRASSSLPSVQIDLDWGKLAHYRIDVREVIDTVAASYAGATIGQVLEDNRIRQVALVLSESSRRDVHAIGRLPLKSRNGEMIELSDVAVVAQLATRYNVLHRAGQRVQAVTANVANEDVGAFIAEVRRRISAEVNLPADIHLEYSGAAVEQARARTDLIIHSILAAVGVLMLIYVALGNLRNLILVVLNLPFALVGGVVAVIVTGASLSLGSLVGFVTLFGITVRNSIMLVSHYRHLVQIERAHWDLDTAVRGAQERFPSIVMTSLVTALAMLPIAVNSDNPGREIMGPMAAIVIGGLLSSALLNLLVMPAVMLRFGRFDLDR